MKYYLTLLVLFIFSSCAPVNTVDEYCDPLAENPHFISECKEYNCTKY